MQPIQAGKLSDMFNKILDSLLKSLKDVFTKSADVKEDTSKTGVVTVTYNEPADHEIVDEQGNALPENTNVFYIGITLTWPKDSTLTKKAAVYICQKQEYWKQTKNISVEMSLGGKDKYTKSDLTADKLDTEIQKYMDKYEVKDVATLKTCVISFNYAEGTENVLPDGVTLPNNIASSEVLNIAVKKIVGSKETSVQLTKINANYDIMQALEDIGIIVADDAFVEQLPENTEISYEITSDDSDYDINECSEFSCYDTIQQMIYMTLDLLLKVRILTMTTNLQNEESDFCSYGELSYYLEEILPILCNKLYDMGCAYINPFEFSSAGVNFEQPQTDESELIAAVENYLRCLNLVIECTITDVHHDLENASYHIEDRLRRLKYNN